MPNPSEVPLAAGLITTIAVPDTPESRNHKLLPDIPAPQLLPAMVQGTLQHAVGGLATEIVTRPPRLVVVASPGTTLLGLARVYLARVNASAASPPDVVTVPLLLTEVDLARGILAYNRSLLGYTGPQLVAFRNLPQWSVGLLLTLPIEIDVANSKWVTDTEQISIWAATLGAADDVALSEAPKPLPIPAPDDEPTTIRARLVGAPAVASLAAEARALLLANPYEAVFRIVELFRQLRAGPPLYVGGGREADVVPFVVALIESLVEHELQIVAQTTAGNAVLRQCQFAMEDAGLIGAAAPVPPDAKLLATRTKLANALGLKVKAAGVWESPIDVGPTVVSFEPSLTSDQQVRTTSNSLFLSAMALGRIVDISQAPKAKKGAAPTWGTLSYAGDPAWRATSWLDVHAKDADIDCPIVVRPGAPNALTISADKMRDRVRIASRISPIEGGLDSTQSGDNGIVSVGLQQWAAHTDDELSVLWERFRVQAPQHFDLFFGMAGLHTKRWANHDTPTSAQIESANPFGQDPATLTLTQRQGYFPLYATFFSVPPGGAAVRLPLPKKSTANKVMGPRVDFFWQYDRARNWCARARLAALCSRDYARVQIQQTGWRFTRIEREDRDRLFRDHPPLFFPVPSAPRAAALTNTVTATAGTIKVSTPSLFAADILLLCAMEIMRVRNVSGNSLTVDRHQQGTLAVAHGTGTRIRRVHGYAVLSANVDNAVTAFPIKPGALAYPGTETVRLLCDAELIACTARTATLLTVTRGMNGTTREAHTADTTIYRVDGDAFVTITATAVATTITVDDASFVPAAGSVLLRCDDELLLCTARAGNILTVTRGAEQSSPAPHDVGAVVYRVAGHAELFVTDFAAAAVLDIHINLPANTTPSIEHAIERTPGDTHAPDGTLNQNWLRRFGVNFLAARATNWVKHLAWENAPIRNNAFLTYHDLRPDEPGGPERGLSPDPGTFRGWERST